MNGIESEELTGSGIADRDFGEVPEVVSLHLEVKDFALGVAGLWNQILVEQRLRKVINKNRQLARSQSNRNIREE